MKCMEVNAKGLNEINVEDAILSVEVGSGTYEEIKEAVDIGKIELLKDAEGNWIGISYNSGKVGAEDALEGLKFEKRFAGHDVMAYVYKAITGKELSTSTSKEELPTEVELDSYDDLDGNDSEKDIANYLRDTYDHYLSGLNQPQFEVDYESGSEYGKVLVNDIQWGRKR